MEKSKKAGVMRGARPKLQSEAEQVLLSHVDLCYSVALALTRDPACGQRLARETLLWAWQRQMEAGPLGGGDIKMALLRDLRSRFLNDFCPARGAGDRSAAPFAFTAGTGENAVCAVAAVGHAEVCAAGGNP